MQSRRKVTIIKVIMVVLAAIMLAIAGLMLKGVAAAVQAEGEPEVTFTIEVTAQWSDDYNATPVVVGGTKKVTAVPYASPTTPNLYRATVPYETEQVKVKVTGLTEGYVSKQQYSKVDQETGYWNFRPYNSSPWKETISIYSEADTVEEDGVQVIASNATPVATYTLEAWRGAQVKEAYIGSKFNMTVTASPLTVCAGDTITVNYHMNTALESGGYLVTFDFVYDENIFEPDLNSLEVASGLSDYAGYFLINTMTAPEGKCLQLAIDEGLTGLTGDIDLATVKLRVKDGVEAQETAFEYGETYTNFEIFYSDEEEDYISMELEDEEFGYSLPAITIYEPSHVGVADSISTKNGKIDEDDDETGYGAIVFDGDNAYEFQTAVGNDVKQISIKVVAPLESGSTTKREEQTVTVSYGSVLNQNVVLNGNGNFEVEVPLDFSTNENVITIKVTAQDRSTSTEYTITVPLSAGEDVNSVESVKLKKSGEADKTATRVGDTFTVNGIGYAEREGWKLVVVSGGQNATVEIANKEGTLTAAGSGEHEAEATLNLKAVKQAVTANEYEVTVTSQTGNEATYNVVVNVALELSADATFTVNDKNGPVGITKSGNNYVVDEDVDLGDAKITVNVEAGAHAEVTIDGKEYNATNKVISYDTTGLKTITVVVRSQAAAAGIDEDGGVEEYRISLKVVDNAADLTLKGKPQVKAGDKDCTVNKEDETHYGVELPKYDTEETKFKVTAEANNGAKTTLKIVVKDSNGEQIGGEYLSGAEILLTGATAKVVITVTWTETKEYEEYEIAISTYRVTDPTASADVSLSALELKVDGAVAELKEIQKGSYYTASVASAAQKLSLKATATAGDAVLTITVLNANGGKEATVASEQEVSITVDMASVKVEVTHLGERGVYTILLVREAQAVSAELTGAPAVTSGGSAVTVSKLTDGVYVVQLEKGMTTFKVSATAADGEVKVYAISANGEQLGGAHEVGEDIDVTEAKCLNVVVTAGGQSATYAIVLQEPAEEAATPAEPEKSGGNGGLIAVIVIFALLFVGATVLLVLELLGIFSLKKLFGKKKSSDTPKE